MGAPSTKALKDRARGISAGILAADPSRLGEAAAQAADGGATLLHFDVMDGVFVPQITAGPAFVAAIGKGMLRDVHLMVADPLRHVAPFVAAGADIVTVHAEAATAGPALRAIRAEADRAGRPVLAGLAVMPGTSLAEAIRLLPEAPDLILSLAIDPRLPDPADIALGGRRMQALARAAADMGSSPVLAFDGGITAATLSEALTFRPDILVAGSAIFRSESPAAACAEFAAGIGAAS